MAKNNPIKRLSVILSKLSSSHCVPSEELIDFVKDELYIRSGSYTGCSLRTIQRDFDTIYELFGIKIAYKRPDGYYIDDYGCRGKEFEALFVNFELLSSIDAGSVLQKYVMPEYRRGTFEIDIYDLLRAVEKSHPIEFDYKLVRHDGKIVHKAVEPYFLKESQQRWYLAGYDDKGILKVFGIDRISSLIVHCDRHFARNRSLDIPALFRESYGIWNNPDDPVEEIILKYDSLDGAFIKTLPLHHTQQIISETPDSLTIKLNLRITNDFVMDILSRSRSVEVIAPQHLRERVNKVWQEALERNKK